MTIMNWALRPDCAMLVSDEIGSMPEIEGNWDVGEGNPWRPHGLRQKVWGYPALGVVMGGMNWSAPTCALMQGLQNGVLVPQSVEELVAFCPPLLADGASTAPLPFITLLFGWSYEKNRMVGYSFDSRRDCIAEPLPDGCCIQPERPKGDISDLAGWLDVTRRQQEMDQALEYGERNHLGGRIIVHELVPPRSGEGPAIIARLLGTLSGAEGLVSEAQARMEKLFDAHGVPLPQQRQ